MKISALKYLIAIAETGSFNKAAKRLFIAQPSLTKSMQQMETELGVTLFERNKSGIQLTPEGEKIYKESRIILDYYEGWKQLSGKDEALTINAYAHISLVGFLIPKLHIPFQKNHANVLLKYQVDADPVKLVSSSHSTPSMALCLNRENDNDKLLKTMGNKKITLMTGYYGCLVNKESPLAKYKALHFSDLKGYCLAYPSHTSSIYNDVSDVVAYSMLSDFIPELVKEISVKNLMTVDSVHTVIKMTSEMPEVFAVSFYPANLRYSDFESGKLACIPFYEPETKGEISLVYSEKYYESLPAYRDLVELIQTEADSFLNTIKNR